MADLINISLCFLALSEWFQKILLPINTGKRKQPREIYKLYVADEISDTQQGKWYIMPLQTDTIVAGEPKQ